MTISADIITGIKTKIAINKKVWGKKLTPEEEGLLVLQIRNMGIRLKKEMLMLLMMRDLIDTKRA